MKHRVKGRKLSRVRKQRKGLIKTLVGSLIVKEKITTTEAKAKEIRPVVDRIIHKAKLAAKDDARKVAILRDLRKDMPEVALKKLSGAFIGGFENRNSGYTRITKLGSRKGDSAKMAVIEFVK